MKVVEFDSLRPWRVYSTYGKCIDWKVTSHADGIILDLSTSFRDFQSKQAPRGTYYWLDLSHCFDLVDGEHYSTHVDHKFEYKASIHLEKREDDPSLTEGCDQSRQVMLEMGIQEAIQMMEKIASFQSESSGHLDATVYSNTSQVLFGSRSVQVHTAAVQRVLTHIDPRCGGQWCESGGSTIAYVYPFDSSYTVYLCDSFWSLPTHGFELDSLPGVLIHEASHFYQSAATLDIAYGIEDCLALAVAHPCHATRNADSFEYLAEILWSYVFWGSIEFDSSDLPADVDTDCLLELRNFYPCDEDVFQDTQCIDTWLLSSDSCTDWEMSHCCICNSFSYSEESSGMNTSHLISEGPKLNYISIFGMCLLYIIKSIII